ncbi:hypothetical protein PAMP_010335 [Pampus punctatissimus]
MDPDSPVARAETTFWSVWYYITGAVKRFLRLEPTDIDNNDPNLIQESAVDSEAANCGLTEGDTCREEVDEEQPLVAVSLLSSSRPVVAWDLCIAENNLGPNDESMQYKTQLSRGGESNTCEEGEDTKEEQLNQTGNDDARLLIAKDAGTKDEEENEDWKLDTPGQDGYEIKVNFMSLNVTNDTLNEESEDQQKMDETVTKIQVQEEDSEMQHEVEQDYIACSTGAEETEIKLSTDLSLEEENNMHMEETGVEKSEVETVVTPGEVENSDGVLQLVSESANDRQGENQFSVCEELSDADRDFEGDSSMVSLDTVIIDYSKSGIVSEDVQIVVGQEQMMLDRVEDQEEEESAVDDEKHSAVIEEENVDELAWMSNNQTADEVPEQENNMETVAEEDITEHVACSEDFTQIATTELQKAAFTDREQEDVAKDTGVQTEKRDDVEMRSRIIVIDGKSDEAKVEEERLSSEDDNNKGCIEIACTTTAITVKPDSEAGQEMSGEFKNIPMAICEGQAVVSQELNFTTREETKEGVPGYNNESGPDENTTQRLLEEGDDEEIQTTQLPEEVESKEPDSLQNSGSSCGGDYLLVREHIEEEQVSRLTTTEDGKNSFDEEAGILSFTDAELPRESEKTLAEPVNSEPGHLFVQVEEQLLDSSMKTGTLEKDFETHVGSAGVKMTKELEDGTEEFLVEFEVDEGLCDPRESDAVGGGHETTGGTEEVARFADETFKLLDAETQKISFCDESVNAINSTSKTFGLLGEVAESGYLKQSVETEPKLLENHSVEMQDAASKMQDAAIEMQDAGIDMEETSYGSEDEVPEDGTQNINETEILNLQMEEMSTELTTTDHQIAALESSTHIKAEPQVKMLETDVQLSDETLEEMSTDIETSEDSMTTELGPKHLTMMSTEEMAKHELDGSYAEEKSSSISGHSDVIHEEILDLWIQAALSEETVSMERQEQQMDTEMEPNEEHDEMQSEEEKEQLVEPNSLLESGLVTGAEIYLSTAESGFLDQSLDEWETQKSETPSSESFQDIDDMLASMSESARISELSIKQPASEPQDLLIEVTAEAGQLYLKEEESITVTDEESDQLQDEREEERVESVETGATSQRDIDAKVTDWKDPEDTNVKSLTKINIQDEPLEINMPDSLIEISSRQSRSDTEASLEEGIMFTDSGLQGETCFESEEKLPKVTEAALTDIAESSPELSGAQVAEQPRTKSEDHVEIDAFVLDFTAQKSRIAVKNPHVRRPKDPRSLLNMPSLDPTPSTRLPAKMPAGVPLGGLGIGIKLPGLGAGFPVLKKTQRVVRDENNPETSSREPETEPEEKAGTPKQDEVQPKPKWMPPRHPGFGNPLMSELKTKLKKTTKE